MPSEIETVRAMLANAELGGDPDAPPDLPALREGYVAMGAAMPAAENVTVEATELGGVPGLKLTPSDAEPGRAILYFHGGGYVIGHPKGHASMVSHIAAASRAVAYSMDYRLAPEAPFPAATEDGLVAYRALLEAGQDSEKLVVSGDSAGGGLTMATALQIRDTGLPTPAGLAPISPWVNLVNDSWSYRTKADSDPMIQKAGIDFMAQTYANGADLAQPLISPVNADLSGLPPVLIQVGSEEVLLSDSVLLAERAGGAGVSVTLEVWPEMIHVFHFFHPFLSDAREAIAVLGDFVEARTL